MKEIEQIYYNDFGVAFYWKIDGKVYKDRIQVVFKETGFYFLETEIKEFSQIVCDMACTTDACNCSFRNKCHRFLLKTPVREIDLAVSQQELLNIKDLLQGTLFNIEMSYYINKVCKN